MLKRMAVLVVLLLCAASQTAYAYTYLRVFDPRQGWYSYPGTIEEAVLSVHPRGIYMEYGLYLTISARGSGFGAADTLEIEYYFDLPEEAIVHDSWLWVGDDIIRADIMDQWTASSIYEDIVRRRRDPSILFKRGPTQYELRVFPMAGNESRKLKITYLVPTQWSNTSVTAQLPMDLLRASATPPDLTVLTWLPPEWQQPAIAGAPSLSFRAQEDPELGTYFRADVPSSRIYESLSFSLKAPLKDGVYVNRYEEGAEGLYQMVFMPSHALDASSARRLAVLVDYDAANSSVTANDILQQLKLFLHTRLDGNDAFNLIFSQFNIRRASETWIPADSAAIEQAFAALGPNPLASYSNLPALLGNGIDFVTNQDDGGTILLLSNADQVGDYQTANQLLDDVLAAADPPVPIHVADFQDQDVQYQYIGGRSYYGNEYFYANVTRMTAGNYVNIRTEGDFTSLLDRLFQSTDGLVTSFDLHTTLENGFCFGRFTPSGPHASTSVSGAIRQVGKYRGTFPFVIQASGVYEGEAFSREVHIPESQAYEADSLNRTIWTGAYIQSLEREPQTNTIVSEIVDYSLRERVLSLYTAFLALEPSQGGEVCYTCVDESNPTRTDDDELPADSLTLEAYPNPFRDQTTILLTFARASDVQDVSVRLYDLTGRVVRSFDPVVSPAETALRLTWDGTSDAGHDVASGVYLCTVTTPNGRHTLKLVRVK